MNLTDSQRRIIEHRGSSLLVSASAGSGKTEVLARRVVGLIADSRRPCTLDQLLVVTFTRAAAAELRQRIARMLRAAAVETADAHLRGHLRRQELLVDAAEIGTIDSWCQRLVRENFVTADVDAAYSILSPDDAAILRRAELDGLMESLYRAGDATAVAARAWLTRDARLDDDFLRTGMTRLNRQREHLSHPAAWLAEQMAEHTGADEALRGRARRLIVDAIGVECARQVVDLPVRLGAADLDGKVKTYLDDYVIGLRQWRDRLADPETLLGVLGDIVTFWKSRRKPPRISEEATELFYEVKQRWWEKRLAKRWTLAEVAQQIENAPHSAAHVRTLIELEALYDRRLEEAKRSRAAYEFSDIQRKALDLLGEPQPDGTRKPTAIAERLRRRYEHVVVDEFQDTSPVQVELMRLVARDEPGRTNPFLVGDLKQSIYGFRQAEPRLFAELIQHLEQGTREGRVEYLSDSFRSRAEIVAGVNAIFGELLHPELGGTAFGEREQLRAGRLEPAGLPDVGRAAIEILLIDQNAPDLVETREDDDADGDAGEEIEEPADDSFEFLERIELEARVAAERIQQAIAAGMPVPQRGPDGQVSLRPADYRDFVILLRAAAGNAPFVARVLRDQGIPAMTSGQEALLDSLEVQDVCHVLRLLANPADELALAAYLRSPLARISIPDLLAIRQAADSRRAAGEARTPFDEAVRQYRQHDHDPDLGKALEKAFEKLNGWRACARDGDLPTLLRRIYADTDLPHFVRALPGGEGRVANLRVLQMVAQQFATNGGGHAEFVEHLAELQAAEIEPAVPAVARDNAVRIMTIHAAKGLEFPVVLVLNTGAKMQSSREGGALVCDAHLGIGLTFLDYPSRTELRSAAHELIVHEKRRRAKEEELRLMYVAATRAKERLIFVGHGKAADWIVAPEGAGGAGRPATLVERQAASSMLDWLRMAVRGRRLDRADALGFPAVRFETVIPPAKDTLQDLGRRTAQARIEVARADAAHKTEFHLDEGAWLDEARRLLAAPIDLSLARQPAMMSVSALKRLTIAGEEEPEDRKQQAVDHMLSAPRFAAPSSAADGRDLGTAVHRFLELTEFAAYCAADGAKREIERLRASGELAPEEAALIPEADLGWFAGTAEARAIATAAAAGKLRRELPFVFAMPLPSLGAHTLLRGIIDCLVDGPDGLILFDYKTDRVMSEAALKERVQGYTIQLQAYAWAIGEILKRPVNRAVLIFLAARQVVDVDPVRPNLAALVELARAGTGDRSSATQVST